MENIEIVFLIVIGNRKQKDNLIKELINIDAKFLNIIYGKGSIKNNGIMEALGLVVEQNKVIITSLMKKEKANCVFEMLHTKFNFDEPNTGIAFTIPVSKIKH